MGYAKNVIERNGKKKMINQLKELLEMQKVLDDSIFKAKGIEEYPLENMKIALFVELGELMNELPTKFKHWKSSAVDNREKALVEYVDCLHFALSVTYHQNLYNTNDMMKKWHDYEELSKEADEYAITEILENIVTSRLTKLHHLLILGNKLGFTWEEIYNAYIAKNKVNYERLKNGY